MKGDPEDRLTFLFKELKEKNLIQDGIKFSYSCFTNGIQGLPIFNKIRCNEKFYTNVLNELDDNTLRFTLLHESNHATNGSSMIYYVYGFLVCVYLLSHYLFHFGLLWLTVFILIAFPLTYRLLFDQMKDEEFKSDIFAAEIMKNQYGVMNPSVFIKNLHASLEEYSEKESGSILKYASVFLIIFVLGIYPDYHPSCIERVYSIEQNVQ